MLCSVTAVLVTFFIVRANTASILHKHRHLQIRQNEGLVGMDTNSSAGVLLTSSDLARLGALSCLTGQNAQAAGAAAWIGSDGTYTNTFTNNAGQDLILVVWGPDASWVNVKQPLITISMASSAVQTVSFASGLSGAWAAIYSDTQTVNGQISNTWGEFTFGRGGVVDVSREPNMQGHSMSIVGPTCTADMNTCVFVCSSGNVCMTDYVLQNCDAGSQTGAQYKMFDNVPSGGCGWSTDTSTSQIVALHTEFS